VVLVVVNVLKTTTKRNPHYFLKAMVTRHSIKRIDHERLL